MATCGRATRRNWRRPTASRPSSPAAARRAADRVDGRDDVARAADGPAGATAALHSAAAGPVFNLLVALPVGVPDGVMDAVGVLDLATERVMRLEPVSLTEAEKLGEAEVEMETVMLTVDEEE